MKKTIEQKSIETQFKLCEDILYGHKLILNQLSDKAKEVIDSHLTKANWPQNIAESEIVVSIPKQNFEEIRSFIQLCSGKYWGRVSKYLDEKCDEIDLKEEILKQLK